MLSDNDVRHLSLLYEQYHKMNIEIRELLKVNDFDGIEYVISNKEKLMKQILQFEKPHIEAIKSNKNLLDFRLKIKEFEKSNIELIKTLKIHLEKEFKQVKKAKKVLHAYEPIAKKEVSTFEINADE